MNSYRDLIAWQKGMELARRVYVLTSAFPADERYGLVSQMRRAAVSIPSNIAEGAGRATTRDWQHFLAQARGSTFELATQLLLAADLGLGKDEQIQEAIQAVDELGRIVNGLLASTRSRSERKPAVDPRLLTTND